MTAEARAALCEALADRAQRTRARWIMTLAITASLAPVIGWPILGWVAGWVVLQVADWLLIGRRAAAATLDTVASRSLAFIFVSGAYFQLLGLAAVLTGETWAQFAGALILVNSLINAAPAAHRSGAMYLANLGALVPFVLALPVLAWLQQASLAAVGATAGASLVMILTSINARGFSSRALDAERRANNSKSEFLATVTHEIRTPLNGVLGMAQAMQVGDLSDLQRSRLDTLRQSGETLLLLLNDVLDLSKIEAGKLELEAAEFDLTPLLGSAHAAFATLAADKALAYPLDIDDTARGRYRGDPGRIRQIIFNLVSNALKFTAQGEVGIRVAREADELCVSVCDTGMGIPPHRLARLFGKFDQLDASTARRFGGTGLGLNICWTLAGLMGGTIEVESREGEGSEFRLRLPLERLGEERDQLAGLAVAPSAPLAAAGLRVLAAEDNAVNQLVLRTLLEQAGVTPTIVGDGAQAVAAWREQPWDIILMDMRMPVMDGLTAVRTIRAEEAATGRIPTPIVALTANAMSHQVAEYAAAGMPLVVAKPIDVEALFAAIERALAAPETTSVAA